MAIELILFDVGGVLGTNGWDHTERAAASRTFGLDQARFEARHEQIVARWESGEVTMDEYLDWAVFNEPRAFTRQAFRDFIFAQSVPNRAMLDYAGQLAATRRYTMMILNNESAELNRYRVQAFGLTRHFVAFLSSCFLGLRKPDGAFYDRALAIAHADPARTVFIDDREPNLVPMRDRGVHTIHSKGLDSVRSGLAVLGVTPSTPEIACN